MIKTYATIAVAALALAPVFAGPSQAEPPRPGQDPLEWCLLNGGENIPQPPGSTIQACCTEDGCIICAADWSDCEFDPPYNEHPGGRQQRFEGADTLAPPSRSEPGRPGGATGPADLLFQLAR